MRRAVGLLIGLGAFLAIILMVTLRRQPPPIPADEVHVPLRGRPEACMSCHGATGVAPRGPNHPFGNECWRCHFEAGEGG